MSKETVNHPNHYGGDTTYEAIKVIEAWGLGFHLGNSVKYISRAGRKDPTKELEDLKKAQWYLDRKIKQLENKVEIDIDDDGMFIPVPRPGTRIDDEFDW
jgi:hypothetical protein